MTMQVLLVEDHNLNQSQSLLSGLEEQGYAVSIAHTLETAAVQFQTTWPNFVVFNQVRGFLLADFQKDVGQIRLHIPHVVVDPGKQSEEVQQDIVWVPADEVEVKQSIEKLLASQGNRFIRFTQLVIDCHQHQVLRNGTVFSLTPKEFKLLYLLIENQDQVLSRKIIMQKVWETDYLGDTRTLDVHVRWLREKIEDTPSHPRRLITVRGVGYRFVAEME